MVESLKGIYKLQEEMNELGVVLAKFGPFPRNDHPSPEYTEQRTLHDHMLEEIADVIAALTYFTKVNHLVVPQDRVQEKVKRFQEWGMSGIRHD